MNKTESQMTEILTKLRLENGVVSVKAEFEAEGTRMDELLRLLDIARSAGLQLTVKIGGCEALRDLLEAKQLGVRYIVAPMVETGYATSKYVSAKNIVYSQDEQKNTDFLFNLETITGFNNVDDLIKSAIVENGVDGIVFGRVDFVGSMYKPREIINLDETTNYVLKVAEKAKQNNLQFVMGGGVSIDSLDVIKKVHEVHLDRFETRKVVFHAESALKNDIEKGLLDAVQFELLWLLNKRDYYSNISHEDNKRIDMLESRWEELKIRKYK